MRRILVFCVGQQLIMERQYCTMMVVRANYDSACRNPSSGWRSSSLIMRGNHVWTARGLLMRMPMSRRSLRRLVVTEAGLELYGLRQSAVWSQLTEEGIHFHSFRWRSGRTAFAISLSGDTVMNTKSSTRSTWCLERCG